MDTHVDDSELENHQNESEGEKTDYERRYKDIQSWSTKVSQKNKELENKLSEMSGKLEVLTQALSKQGESTVVEEKDPLDDIDPMDLLDKPENLKAILKDLKKGQNGGTKAIIDQITAIFDARDKALAEKFERYNPEQIRREEFVSAYKDEIEELKQDPDLADLSDLALAKIAHKTSQKEEGYEPRFIPQIGGRRVSIDASKSRSEKEVDAIMERIYKDTLKEKK